MILPQGYNVLGVVSEQVDVAGLPQGQVVNFGPRLCLEQTEAVKVNVLLPNRDANGNYVFLAQATEPDNQGRNCGSEGAANMRPIDRRIFHGLVPEDLGLRLECLGLSDESGMFWVRRIQN